jgi:signal peptidase II
MRLGLVFVILIAWIGCDQVVKQFVRVSLLKSPPISLLNDSIHLSYTENPGAFLGLGANLPGNARNASAIAFASLVLIVTLVAALNTRSPRAIQLAGLALVAAGGLGNLIDRLSNNGSVIDFLRLGIGPVHTGVFNVADVAIVTGLILFLVFSPRGGEDAPVT